MTSRERVRKAIAHEPTDRVPIDLGSTAISGIHASAYARLKKALGITSGVTRVYEPYQMLGEVEDAVRKALGVDTAGIAFPNTIFGYKNENWKRFRMFDGTEVEISGNFQYDVQPDGSIVQYPKGDRSAPPSGRMPKDGYFFDTIVRQEPIDEAALDPREFVEQSYSLYSEEDMRFLETESTRLYRDTEYSLVGNFAGGNFGDIAFVPGPDIPYPKGIRDPEEWYVSIISRRGYIEEIFRLQLEVGMKNLEMYRQAVGDRIDVVVISGTDFGSQNGPFIAPQTYREIFKPLHKTVNDWVHAHTPWKTFYHTCGSIVPFLDDFAEAGVDILNPVQISAAGMAPELLKDRYGKKFTFWGGAVDAQHTLAFGTPGQVGEEARRNVRVFGKGGGFVFNNVHNIQATVPTENIVALFEAARGKDSHR
jgi:hypothetical protein